MNKTKVEIICEIGINHNGSLDRAKEMIRVAAGCGVSICKFQYIKTAEMYRKDSGFYTTKSGTFSIYEALESCEIAQEWLPILIDECKVNGVRFLTAIYDHVGLDEILPYQPDAIKLASYEISFLSLFERLGALQMPLIFSTAGAGMGDIELAYQAYGRPEHACIMHCNGKYPASRQMVNMNVLKTLAYAFPQATIGFSDHTEDPVEAPVAAVALGARMIEKHFTLDRSLPGPDHVFAATPEGLASLVRAVRETEERLKQGETITIDPVILGSSAKYTQNEERYIRNFCYRSIYTKQEIRQGEPFSAENLAILRAGEKEQGLHPKYMNNLIGLHAPKDIPAGTPLNLNTLLA